MIPAEAVEAAAAAIQVRTDRPLELEDLATAALEAAAPNMPVEIESKLAAVIVALDPFERVANQIAASDDAMRRAFDAVLKIRAILDNK